MDPAVSIRLTYERVYLDHHAPFMMTHARAIQWKNYVPAAYADTEYSLTHGCFFTKAWGITADAEKKVFDASMRHLANLGCQTVRASGYINDESLLKHGFERMDDRMPDLDGMELPSRWQKDLS